MKDKLISVIVPVYKVEEFLPRCIDSIVNQTYKDLEIILIDDGSPDSCGKICDSYAQNDKRVKVYHIQNGGVSAARNFGLDKATGEFISFVDSDDFLEEDMYEKLIASQTQNDSDVVFCRYFEAYDDTKYVLYEESLEKLVLNKDISYFFKIGGKGKIKNEKLCYKYYVMGCIWRCLIKNSALKNLRFNSNIKFMEDTLFVIELLLKPNLKTSFVDKPLYNYYIRQSAISRNFVFNYDENVLSFISGLKGLLEGTEFEYLYKANLFYWYTQLAKNKIKYKLSFNLKDIEKWNTGENYKLQKKLSKSFKFRFVQFIVHHKLWFIFKIIYGIRG